MTTNDSPPALLDFGSRVEREAFHKAMKAGITLGMVIYDQRPGESPDPATMSEELQGSVRDQCQEASGGRWRKNSIEAGEVLGEDVFDWVTTEAVNAGFSIAKAYITQDD